MLTMSEQITKIASALLAVQSKVSGVQRDAKADAGRRVYKYATLEAVIDAVRAACIEAGVILLQAPQLDAATGTVSIETRLVHAASGEWVACVSSCAANAGDAQAIGSAQTYMRRYGLMSLLGLAPEDDDGQAARGAPTGQQQPPRQPIGSQRDRIIEKLLGMYRELGVEAKGLDKMTEQELVAEGQKLRKLIEEKK